MSDESALALVRWTVCLAILAYALRVVADAGDFASLCARRVLWTAGLVFYLAHVAAAFHFVHAWNHDAALRETARQTELLTGWRTWLGLWANYAFTLLWIGDVAAWWAVGAEYPLRCRRTYAAVQAAFAFIVFNATAVFGPPAWRLIVAAFALFLAAALAVRAKRSAARNG
jgi:hypothetical protein